MRQKTSQAHQDGSEETCSQPGFFTTWRDIPVALRILLTNPVLMFPTGAAVLGGLLLTGYLTFLPKFVQNQFGITATWAALVTGRLTYKN